MRIRKPIHNTANDLQGLKRRAFLNRRGAAIEKLECRRLLAAGDLDPSFDGDGMAVGTMHVTEPGARAAAVQADGKIVVATQALDASQFIVRRYTASGAPDTSFGGGDGAVTLPFGGAGPYRAEAIAVQSDGKIVAAGGAAGQFAVARLNANGTPDTTFSGDGVHVFSMGTDTFATDVALQTDGKIVLSGHADGLLAAARLTTSGGLDSTFSGDGKASFSLAVGLREWANAVAIQPDGKIVLAGGAEASSSNENFAVLRLNANGSLDTTFAGDGSVVTDFAGTDDDAFDVVVQPDGKIVAGGSAYFGFGTGSPDTDFVVARYNANGTPDATFDGDGRFRLAREGTQRVEGIVLQGTKIVIGGPDGWTPEFGLRRLNANGTVDTTFGDGGATLTPFFGGQDVPYALAAAPGEKLVLAGEATEHFGSFPTTALARYDAGGHLDTSFGTDGKASPSIAGASTGLFDVFVQPDGKVLAFGSAQWLRTGPGPYFFVRHNANGSLDTGFGDGGYARVDLPQELRFIDTAVQPDGKIVVVGYTANVETGWPITIARFNTDGTPDTTFSGDGRDQFVHANFSEVTSVAILPDGKILLSGEASYNQAANFNDFERAMLVRYNANGTRDTSFGPGGIREYEFGAEDERFGNLRIQNDGKIVAFLGYRVSPSFFHEVIRFNPNGTIDSTFGRHALTHIPASFSHLELQPDGKIVLAGRTKAEPHEPYLYRITTSGQQDPTFNNGPLTEFRWRQLNEMLIQPDGRILLQGTGDAFNLDDDIKFGRLLANGQPDPSFGSAGEESIPSPDRLFTNTMVLAPDGKIVGAGNTPTNYGFIRLLNDTTPPPTSDSIYIDSAGVVHVDGTSGADEISVQYDLNTQFDVTLNGASESFDVNDVTGFVLNGFDGNDSFLASLITLADGPDRAVTLNGGNGDDDFEFGEGTIESVSGGAGDDFVIYDEDNAPDSLSGGTGTDGLVWEGDASNPDTLDLNNFPDVENADIYAGTLIGNALNNRLVLTGGGGTIQGGGGNDTLFSQHSAAAVHLFGQDGNDWLIGNGYDSRADGQPATTLEGQAGNDTLESGLGNEVLSGGSGLDTLDYSARTTNLNITLGTTADDGAAGEGDNAWVDIETVLGGSGNDFIAGNGLNNLLRGNGGNDRLRGFGGNDALYGGGGHDRLEAGAGNDYLGGESGNDALLGEAGTDFFVGGDGDDWLYARDGISETVNGGPGFDRAQRDPSDSVLSIESFIA